MSAKVRHDIARKLFSYGAPDKLAILQYRQLSKQSDAKQTIELYHTEVPDAYRGQGVGALLVEAALDYFKTSEIIPSCSFVAHYLNKKNAALNKL